MVNKLVLLALAVQAIASLPSEDRPVDYSQHKLIRILPKQMSEVERLEELRPVFDMKVDLWNNPMSDMRPVLSLVSPQGMDFLNALNSSHINYEIVSNSFQKLVDKERDEIETNQRIFRSQPGMERALNYETAYNNYQSILDELKAIGASSSKATYLRLGTTYQGREIPAIIVTNPGGSAKKSIILECGIHSREWISTASCLWIMNQLLTNSALDSYLNKYEFVIVPALNSDGYVHTWTSDRMWRKTRRPYGSCYGSDPNRNWDAAHCASGASTNPCSDTYCGPSPFSESCTKAMSNMMAARKGNIAAYFAIHSYSQMWMYPYGYSSSKQPTNLSQLRSMSTAAVNAIKSTNGLTWTYGAIADIIYIASGSSIDWAYDALQCKVAFALELRDKGAYGFQLPASQIRAGCTETWNGIKAVIDLL